MERRAFPCSLWGKLSWEVGIRLFKIRQDQQISCKHPQDQCFRFCETLYSLCGAGFSVLLVCFSIALENVKKKKKKKGSVFCCCGCCCFLLVGSTKAGHMPPLGAIFYTGSPPPLIQGRLCICTTHRSEKGEKDWLSRWRSTFFLLSESPSPFPFTLPFTDRRVPFLIFVGGIM